MRTKLDSPEEFVRIEFTRALQLRRFPVAKGEAIDLRRSRINDDGSVDVDGSIVLPGLWVEVATWTNNVPAPPLTASQIAAAKSLDGGGE
jgi:hypothetical protein